MELNLETLLNPPFAQDPPVKINVNAKTLGAVIAVLAVLGVVGVVVTLLSLLALGSMMTAVGYGGIVFLSIIGLIVDLVAELMALVGGWRMYHENPDGKRLVIYSLAIGILGQIVAGVGHYSISGPIFSLILLAVVYYVVILSRFPTQPTVAPGQ